MDSRIKEVIISEEQIKNAIVDAAKWIDLEYKDKDLALVTILKGSIPFVGSLIPKITIDFIIDYIAISSFKGGTSAQTLPELISNNCTNLKGKDVLLVEDIVDSGRTIKMVVDIFKQQGCKSIKILTLLDKKEGRKVSLDVDYKCFDIPKEFIVGFGLDYQEKMRNLPYIGILKEEIYKK